MGYLDLHTWHIHIQRLGSSNSVTVEPGDAGESGVSGGLGRLDASEEVSTAPVGSGVRGGVVGCAETSDVGLSTSSVSVPVPSDESRCADSVRPVESAGGVVSASPEATVTGVVGDMASRAASLRAIERVITGMVYYPFLLRFELVNAGC